jgi:hypothetical protein
VAPLIKVVTAFTVAHSLTLSLAVLDVVRLPSSIVEPLIAATIVYVAAENFFVHDISKRWRATFVLGLVHGFGFAGALREYGVPDRALIPALAAFNIGVEIGQVAIVSLIFPLLLLSDRTASLPAETRTARQPGLCLPAVIQVRAYHKLGVLCLHEVRGARSEARSNPARHWGLDCFALRCNASKRPGISPGPLDFVSNG